MKYLVFNETDGILAHPEPMTDVEAQQFIETFRERFKRQGYYASVNGRIPISEVTFSLRPIGALEKMGATKKHIEGWKRCRCMECQQKRLERGSIKKTLVPKSAFPLANPRQKRERMHHFNAFVVPQEQSQHHGPDPLVMPVICRARGVIFLRLPGELQRECGLCECEYCKAHPEGKSMLDALAVEVLAPHGGSHSWPIHMPDPELFLRLIRQK